MTNDCLLTNHIPTLLSLWRKNNNKNPLTLKELEAVSNNLLNLQRGLTGDRALAGSGYMDNSPQLGAYLLYYWPVSYMQIYWAAKNCPPLFKNLSPSKTVKILDIGSGPAPASVTLCDLLKQNGIENISVTLIDSSSKALDLAKRIYSADFKSVTIKTRVQNFENEPINLNETFDIIVMSHALNELWREKSDFIEKRTDFLKTASHLLNEDGFLFLSEPALLETSRSLMKVRDNLLDSGFSILSPCYGNKHCPALEAGSNQTCHAEIKWSPQEPISSIAKKAKLDRESVKMTYFIFQKGDKSVPIQYRVVSDSMLNKSGRLRFLLCDGKKRIAISAKKDDPYAKKIGFFNLSRYDTVSVENPEIRGDSSNPAFGIQEGTDLRVQKFSNSQI